MKAKEKITGLGVVVELGGGRQVIKVKDRYMAMRSSKAWSFKKA